MGGSAAGGGGGGGPGGGGGGGGAAALQEKMLADAKRDAADAATDAKALAAEAAQRDAEVLLAATPVSAAELELRLSQAQYDMFNAELRVRADPRRRRRPWRDRRARARAGEPGRARFSPGSSHRASVCRVPHMHNSTRTRRVRVNRICRPHKLIFCPERRAGFPHIPGHANLPKTRF